MNYFEIFNIQNSFKIDVIEIERKYLELQKQYLQYAVKNDAEQMQITSILADLNNAYKTLKDDYLRAAYILKLRNIDIENDEENRFKMPEFLLARIIEKREYVENLEAIEILEQCLDEEEKERDKILDSISACEANCQMEEMIINIMMLKYQDNLINIIDQKIERCF